MPVVLLVIVIGALALNVWASVRIAHDQFYDRGQRVIQFALVWLVPFVGSALVLYFTREAEPRQKTGNPVQQSEGDTDGLLRSRRSARRDDEGDDAGSHPSPD
jgi:hypothetical protein